MQLERYRLKWLKNHRSYEKRAFRIFRRHFMALGETLSQLSFDQNTYKATFEANVTLESIQQAYIEAYREIGQIHGRRMGYDINRQLKAFSLDAFLATFNANIAEWVLQNCGQNIISVRQTFVDYIIKLVSDKFEQGLTVSQVATEIQKVFRGRNFYRWQALRIARTESTAAANHGALESGRDSGIVLEKMWISAIDARTRRIPRDTFDHLEMNGVRVGENETFTVRGKLGNDVVRFPGDPEGRAGDIINCRCSVALVPKRDSEGQIIFR